MCHAALGHGIPRAGAGQGTHPRVGPCFQELAANHAGPKPWEWSHNLLLPPMWGKARPMLLPAFSLKVLFQNPMCARSQWSVHLFNQWGLMLPMFTFPPLLPPCWLRGQSLEPRMLCTRFLLLSHQLLICLGQPLSSGGPCFYSEDKLLLTYNSSLAISPHPLPSPVIWSDHSVTVSFLPFPFNM